MMGVSAQSKPVVWILVVDDNPADLYLLREMLAAGPHSCRVDCVRDGSEALEFLQRQSRTQSRLPDLVLMDVHMPRFDGLETLSAIKQDSELRVIPVIMLSTFALPAAVRRSYQAYASGFVQKPTNIEQLERLVAAIRAFWMDFVIYTSRDHTGTGNVYWNLQPGSGSLGERESELSIENVGYPFATERAEASNGARNADGLVAGNESANAEARMSPSGACEESHRLLNEFATAVEELMRIHEQQLLAIVQTDPESNRFDLLIHMANEKKQQAKYAYLRHVESHGCLNMDAVEPSRT
ncbi:MAG TPA: response regulator [Bryobacteraceae bacterium]|jgi:CheY-like chemotaxis protein